MKKTILTITVALAIAGSIKAQDTMFVHQQGGTITKIAVNKIDSIVFYKASISTPPISTVTTNSVIDIDGNTYKTATLGTQTWMAENLKVTKYNDGTAIPIVTDNTEWSNLVIGAQCSPDNDISNVSTYGRLYNWSAVNTSKLCPTGWHVPNDNDWTILKYYLIANGFNYDGGTTGNKIGKSLASTTGWGSYSQTGAIGNKPSTNNRSGFTALPAGYRGDDGTFFTIGCYGVWWSFTDIHTRYMHFQNNSFDSATIINSNNMVFTGNSVRCIKDELTTGIIIPSITTQTTTAFTQTKATGGGIVTNTGGASITAQGICWSLSNNPTIADNKTSESLSSSSFISTISGLTAGTTYYVRAYATNRAGTAYGTEQKFITPLLIDSITYGSMTDVEKNVYKTVTIGTQTWMAENLKVTHYNDGTEIPNYEKAWDPYSYTGAVCDYNNTSINGKLYNWNAVNTGKLCPTGWHVPNNTEWTTLQNYLITNSYNYDGSTSANLIAKSLASSTGWLSSTNKGAIGNNPSTNNRSGFTALPSGYRNSYGAFNYSGSNGYWWSFENSSASTRNIWALSYSGIGLYQSYDGAGLSVRCLKD